MVLSGGEFYGFDCSKPAVTLIRYQIWQSRHNNDVTLDVSSKHGIYCIVNAMLQNLNKTDRRNLIVIVPYLLVVELIPNNTHIPYNYGN